MNRKCLDYGFLDIVSNTNDGDLLVVNAARCSFDKEHKSFDKDKDTKLINYLAKHEHLLPFRHPSATLRMAVPIFVLRQLGKHQVGFSWSEVSRRYITKTPQFYMPDDWRLSAENVKQGSSDELLSVQETHYTNAEVDSFITTSYNLYNKLLDKEVCAEQARLILPQNMYTTTVVTGSLLGWFHMFKMRTEPHTQRETQDYAIAVGDIMEWLFPISWRALCEHCL